MALEGAAKDIRHHLQLVTEDGMNTGYTAVGALPGPEGYRTPPIQILFGRLFPILHPQQYLLEVVSGFLDQKVLQTSHYADLDSPRTHLIKKYILASMNYRSLLVQYSKKLKM